MQAWPAAVSFAVIIGTAWALSKRLGAPAAAGRFASIDGLRGYLAAGVFVHHATVWRVFLQSGVWTEPPSNFYNNLGQASVVLFFMITGFLFWTKLLRGRSESINWYKLYLSRLLRLVPLYAFAMLLVFLTIGIATDFRLREPVFALSKHALHWGAFLTPGFPDLNGFEQSFIVVAGVTWTLGYEWLFYLTLPLMAVLVGAAPPRAVLAGAVLVVGLVVYQMRPEWHYLAAFGGGILAASLAHFNLIHKAAGSRMAAVIAVAAILYAMLAFPTAYQPVPMLLLSLAFTIIAGGNAVFGVLAWPASRFLGQLTYSLYLLHGIFLFCFFYFCLGYVRARSFSLPEYWLAVWLAIPMLLLICCATFRFVELPGMRGLYHVRAWYHGWSMKRTG